VTKTYEKNNYIFRGHTLYSCCAATPRRSDGHVRTSLPVFFKAVDQSHSCCTGEHSFDKEFKNQLGSTAPQDVEPLIAKAIEFTVSAYYAMLREYTRNRNQSEYHRRCYRAFPLSAGSTRSLERIREALARGTDGGAGHANSRRRPYSLMAETRECKGE